MKYILAFLVSVSVLAVEQNVEVSSAQPSSISLRFTGSAGDPNNGSVPYSTPGNAADTNFVFANFAGPGPDFVIYDVINSGATVTPAITRAIVEVSRQPTLGTCVLQNTGTLLFTPNGASGDDSIEIRFLTPTIPPGAEIGARRTIAVKVLNQPPTISVSASPSLIAAGGSTSFLTTTADLNGHAVTISYDYGDGNFGTSAEHTYASAGVYTITATANDGFGGIVTAQTAVTVVDQSHVPVARFTTSDIVAFVNVPLVLDGITSTDEQNSIVSYLWKFGDGTPLGSVATLSHIYKSVGPVTITLTVTDAEGFSSTVSRDIEVLAEAAAATFDSEVRISTTYFPQKQNRDNVQVFARVNIGDAQLGAGSTVALEYAGKRFATMLDKKGKGAGFTIKQNLRRQAPGTVEITFKARNTAIASMLDAAGAIDGRTVDVPFRLELGLKTILVDVPTDFEVGAARGKGLGELD